jgi:hypothetical protein
MKIGALDITNCKIGSTQVNEVRIGSTLVWQYATVDPDAQAFLNATGITDLTITNAINTLVVDLKGYSLWAKMKALYPFVGGTATTHKFNLINPLDTDAAFRLVFNGGWTHSANGVRGNGTNAFADTKLNAFNVLSRNFNSIGMYNRTLLPLVNTYNGVGNPNYFILGTGDATNRRIDYWANASSGLVSSNTNAIQGFSSGSRTTSTLSKLYKNGTLNTSYVISSNNLPAFNFYIGAVNTGTGSTIVYNDFELALFYLSDGIDDTEAANLYTAVQAFQTALSRNV